MKFTIDLMAVADGWEARLLDPATGQAGLRSTTGELLLDQDEASRPLQRLDVAPGESYPLPPTSDSAKPPALKPDDLSQAYSEVMNQRGDVWRFGRYLFDTLLGQTWWNKIEAAAGQNPIELALTWPAGEQALNRLPWEIMCNTENNGAEADCKGFLAASPEVAITRRIKGTDTARYRLDNLPSPARVLFVVGSSLTDPVIRPGAEYLGLLRHVEKGSRYLHHRLLLNATTTSLERSLQEFSPNIVHIICHGLVYEDKAVLEFRSEQGGIDPDYVTAPTLAKILESVPPAILVLNACSTATTEELLVGRPMAADLVERGVPIVVGMSGRVADQACRLFARGFFEALLDGGDIAQAAARGRRAAILHGGVDACRQIDWALPALFLTQAIGEASLNIKVNDYQVELLRRALEFSIRPDYPVFCGRWDFFDEYKKLMSGTQYRFMAVAVPRADNTNTASAAITEYGSERLLQELAAQAMRDGHIPILLTKTWVEREKWPSRLQDFLEVLGTAVDKTVQIFSKIAAHATLGQDWQWKYLPLLCQTYPALPAETSLPDEFSQFGRTPDQRLAIALRRDLLTLRQVVCAQRGLAEDADIKLLLLLDDVHQLVFSQSLFTLFEGYGLSHSAAEARTRGVIFYHQIPLTDQATTVNNIKSWAKSANVLHTILGPFHKEVEKKKPMEPEEYNKAAIIYRHFLLHWREEHKNIPLALGLPENDPSVRAFIQRLARAIQGYPSNLETAGDDTILAYRYDLGYLNVLRLADDEDALKDLANVGERR